MHPLRDSAGPPPAVVATTDHAGVVEAIAGAVHEVFGCASDAMSGVDLIGLAGPRSRRDVDELLHGNAEHAVLAGRRLDGLPLVADLAVLSRDATRLSLLATRSAGPVVAADSPGGPAPSGLDIDRVLSHDARAAIRHARTFFGLLQRDTVLTPSVDAGIDVAAKVMRALDLADAMVAESVRYMRLIDVPLRCRPTRVADLVALALHDETKHDRAEVTTSLDDLEVMAEPDLLAWTIGEFLANARTFAPGTPIHIGARSHDGWVTITVSDGGNGIDPAMADAALQPGRMLRPRDESPGVGMGLAIAQRIAQRHGGRVHIGPSTTGAVVEIIDLPGHPNRPVG